MGDAKGKGGFGFGFGSKKKKKDKKKKSKRGSSSDSDSDSDDDKKKNKTGKFGFGGKVDADLKTPEVDGKIAGDADLNINKDIKVDGPDVDINLEKPKVDADLDADGKVKGPKGGFDINMPDINMPKMPKFGFGGKGKKPDGEIDVSADASLPSVDADLKVKTPEGEIP